MPPTIILIRHAEAQHNLTKDYTLRDPPLTEKGLQQCKSLATSLSARFSNINSKDVAIIVSPMQRTLQTAQLALDWLVDQSVKIVADADWQENSDLPCDTGSDLEIISGTFPSVDFTNVDPIFPQKDKPTTTAKAYHYTRPSVLGRGKRCIANLTARKEKFVFVVSHSAFLRLGVVGWGFENADYRIFEIEGGELRVDEGTVMGGLGLSCTERFELGKGLPEEVPEVE